NKQKDMYEGPGESFLHKWHQEILVQSKKLSFFLFEQKTAHHQLHDQLGDLCEFLYEEWKKLHKMVKCSPIQFLDPPLMCLQM
ncbi:hypothetical protein Tco_0220717, partial [Tanacetum coccineum]